MRAYSHQGHGPRADQQAGYISATTDRTTSLANGSRSIHSGQHRKLPTADMGYRLAPIPVIRGIISASKQETVSDPGRPVNAASLEPPWGSAVSAAADPGSVDPVAGRLTSCTMVVMPPPGQSKAALCCWLALEPRLPRSVAFVNAPSGPALLAR